MATAKKKTPTKRASTSPKKPAARKSPSKKPVAASKKSAKGTFYQNALNDARVQMDMFMDSAKLKAKAMAAKEKLMQKQVELAASAEMDKARHLALQAEKWMKARIKSDTKKINALEKKLTKQLHSTERKLVAQAKSAERILNKQGSALKKKIESGTKKAFAKAPAKVKVAAAKKKATAPKKKAAASKSRSRAKK